MTVQRQVTIHTTDIGNQLTNGLIITVTLPRVTLNANAPVIAHTVDVDIVTTSPTTIIRVNQTRHTAGLGNIISASTTTRTTQRVNHTFKRRVLGRITPPMDNDTRNAIRTTNSVVG